MELQKKWKLEVIAKHLSRMGNNPTEVAICTLCFQKDYYFVFFFFPKKNNLDADLKD